MVDISSRTGNLLSRKISKSMSTDLLAIFAYRIKHFWTEVSNQIKNSDNVKEIKIKFGSFWKNDKRNDLRGHFWELSEEFTKQNLISKWILYQ